MLLTARDVTKGKVAAHKLAQAGVTVLPRQLDVAESATIDSLRQQVEHEFAGIVWAATLPDNGPTSGFFRDGRSLAW